MKMKCERLFVVFVVIFSLTRIALCADSRPGVMIYMEPPVLPLKLPAAIPFSSYQKTSVEYGNLTSNGRKIEIHNAGVIGIFPYPPATVDRYSADELTGLEQRANEVVARFPNVRSSIESVLSKWKSAVELAGKQASLGKLEATPLAAPVRLTVNGINYAGVTLESVNGDNAKISHSFGIASIPIASLSKAQIASLNSTSSSSHIDPFWSEKKKLAEQAKAKP